MPMKIGHELDGRDVVDAPEAVDYGRYASGHQGGADTNARLGAILAGAPGVTGREDGDLQLLGGFREFGGVRGARVARSLWGQQERRAAGILQVYERVAGEVEKSGLPQRGEEACPCRVP